MVVYADILICLNTIVTYLIILAASAISCIKIKIMRLIIASLVGGTSSLYIYLPQQSLFTELILKLVFSAVITVVFSGRVPLKSVIRFFVCFYVVSFIYAGFMMAFWMILKPGGMAINNGVVYFSVSPIILIISTAVGYVVITLALKFLNRDDRFTDKKTVSVYYNSKSYLCRCMVDTGNSLCDTLGDCKIIILSRSMSDKILGESIVNNLLNHTPDDTYKTKLRLLPYKTLSSNGLIPALRVDEASVDNISIKNVLIAISECEFDGEVDGIISPDFLL